LGLPIASICVLVGKSLDLRVQHVQLLSLQRFNDDLLCKNESWIREAL